jgi:hypothetical protein
MFFLDGSISAQGNALGNEDEINSRAESPICTGPMASYFENRILNRIARFYVFNPGMQFLPNSRAIFVTTVLFCVTDK